LLLQRWSLIAPLRQEHRTGGRAAESGGQGIAWLQKTQLVGPGLIEGAGTFQLRIAAEVMGQVLEAAGGLHFAQQAEQVAEAHGGRGLSAES
jgi:hypothetical protein